MLNNATPIQFVTTAQPANAREFYETKLGFHFIVDEPFALVFEACGLSLRVQKVETVQAAQGTVLGWMVTDIAATVKALQAQNISFKFYSFMEQDELGICTFEDGAQVAWFVDPDGNILSLTQEPGS